MNTLNRCLKCCVTVGTASLLFCLGSLDAQAQCAVTPANSASFGTVTSFTVRAASQSTSTPNSGLTCSGAVIGQVAGDQINMTASSQNNRGLRSSMGDAIPYEIYADANATTQIDPGTNINWASGQFRNALSVFRGPSQSLPLYFRTVPGSNVAAGIYTDTVTLNWGWNYCRSRSLLGCSARGQGSGTSTFTLTLVVTNDCTIAAPNISFGAAPNPASFSPVTGGIAVTCTKGLTYTVGLSGGSFRAANGRRQMASSGGRLQYDIFNSGGATVWGQDTNRVSSVRAADGSSVQQFPFVAVIYADQATPPVGTYADTVVIDVRY
jgi:spore coat protein U-like protein